MLWITEYDETKDRELFRQDCLAEGRAEGRAEEAERMGNLFSRLLNEDRLEDAKKASADVSYRQQLYKEFNL